MKRIIFKNKDNSIGIITPADEALSSVGIKAIAEKEVKKFKEIRDVK